MPHRCEPLTKSIFRSILYLSTFTISVDAEMLTHFRIGDLDRIFSHHIGPRNLVTTYILDTSSSALVDQLLFVQIACPESVSLKSDTSLLSGSSRESSAPRVGSKRTPPSSATASAPMTSSLAQRHRPRHMMGIQRIEHYLRYGQPPPWGAYRKTYPHAYRQALCR